MTTYYWYGGTGTWDGLDSTHWSTAPNGTGVPGVPSSIDDVVFDQAAPYSVFCGSGDGAANCLNLTISAGTVTLRQGSDLCQVHGSLEIINSPNSDLTIDFFGSASRTIQTSGTRFAGARFNNSGTTELSGPLTLLGELATQNGSLALDTNGYSISAGSLRLSGGTINLLTPTTVTVTGSCALNSGTLNLNGNTLTCASFNSIGAGTRSIIFGSTGSITTTGTGTVWDTATNTSTLTISGTSLVNINNGAGAATVSSGTATEANSISFTFNGSAAITLSAGSKKNLTFNGSGSVTNTAQTIYGNLTINGSTAFTSGTNAWTFASTSLTTRTITSNSGTLGCPITFNGVGGSWSLADNFTMVGSTRDITQTNGTLDLNGKTLTCAGTYVTAAGTKALTFNGGTLLLNGTGTIFNNAQPTGYTTNQGLVGGGIIYFSGSTISAKTANFGNFITYNCSIRKGSRGNLIITGANNTFDDFTNDTPTGAFDIRFTAGTSNSFKDFNLNGISGTLITLTSVTASQHVLNFTGSGRVSCNYLNISYSQANPSSTWYAGTTSTDSGNNSGWIFTAPPSVANTGAFFLMF